MLSLFEKERIIERWFIMAKNDYSENKKSSMSDYESNNYKNTTNSKDAKNGSDCKNAKNTTSKNAKNNY